MPAPDIAHPHRSHQGHLPSWDGQRPGPDGFLNEDHARIWQATSHIAGWQEEGDTVKLYEMGYFAGDIILEIGTYAGRSSRAILAGALANPARTTPPRFFGIDIHLTAMADTFGALHDAGLSDLAYMHLGTLQEFVPQIALTPTMVFLDGDHRYPGVKKDLDTLTTMLPPGIPVLCHDYTSTETDGVRRGCDEWEAAGCATFYGVFGCSALYVTAEGCTGSAHPPLSDADFQRLAKRQLVEGLEGYHMENQSVHLFCQRQLTVAGRDCQGQIKGLETTVLAQLAAKDQRIAALETPLGAVKSLVKGVLQATGLRKKP